MTAHTPLWEARPRGDKGIGAERSSEPPLPVGTAPPRSRPIGAEPLLQRPTPDEATKPLWEARPRGEVRTVLWWGRFDPAYSRNRILRRAYAELGWRIVDFRLAISALGDVEAALRGLPAADLVHVPCFRQRDMAAALRFARRHGIPLVFDPLISAWDKQVFERRKFAEDSAASQRLRAREGGLFRAADCVLADTPAHADFFRASFGLAPERLAIVHVGAEEDVFTPQPPAAFTGTLEVLFYGSFLALQGPEVVVEAARLCSDLPIRFRMVGEGPLRAECERRARGLDNLVFEGWLSYQELVERIRRAHVVLGIFGTTPKATRVIPNKAYQAMACARLVITRASPAWPASLTSDNETGLILIKPGNAADLSDSIKRLSQAPRTIAVLGEAARRSFEHHFSAACIEEELQSALSPFFRGSADA